MATAKRIDESRRLEILKSSTASPDTDQPHSNLSFIRNRHDDASFGGPIQFGQSQPGYPYGLMELAGLRQRCPSPTSHLTSKTSCGAPGEACPITLGPSEFIHQMDFACRRPAVSIKTTSACRALAAAIPS